MDFSLASLAKSAPPAPPDPHARPAAALANASAPVPPPAAHPAPAPPAPALPVAPGVHDAVGQLLQLSRAHLQLPVQEVLRLRSALKLLRSLQPGDARLDLFWTDAAWAEVLASAPDAGPQHWQQLFDDVVAHLTH